MEIKQKLTLRIQHARDVEVLLSNIKGSVEILQRVVLGQLAVVDEVWSVAMDESAEGQTILEARKRRGKKINISTSAFIEQCSVAWAPQFT